MSKTPFGSELPIIGYACFIAALFLFVRGYQFNTNDQAEHLPQIYQMLDAELYPTDYFVNVTNSIFTVRYYYEQLVLLVAKTIGVEWGLFILTFCCIAIMAYSFSSIAEVLFNDRWAMLLAPLLIMFVFYNFTVGGNHIMYTSFISSTGGKAIASFGLLQYFRNRFFQGGIYLGLATLMQPLVGLQLFVLVTVVEVVVKRNWKGVIESWGGYLPVAAFILVPIFIRQFGEEAYYDKGLYYHILYVFRNHHHYLPSLFPQTHYLKFFFLTTIGVVGYALFQPKNHERVRGILMWGIAGMFVYILGLQILEIDALGKLQWFKVTVWISALSSIMIAGVLGQLVSGINGGVKIRKFLLPISLLATILLLLSMTNSKYLSTFDQGKWMVGNRVHTDLETMHFWIEENTAKDISVLVSPDNNAFPSQAKRSMPIHYQAIIHEPFFMLPWYADYREIYGVSIENLEGIDARKHAVNLFQTRNYRGSRKRIDYRLDNLETCQFKNELGTVLHQEGSWVLTHYLPLNPS
jgi:hypothetical protein